MALIHVLDETTINKIAAGEVVERPASVIKELVENSIDAGSTSIEVEIAQGGVEYMRITDNGIGMTEEDARLAVLRHATSKIKGVEDLFEIASLGFRGEALASIASVSHFLLTTRPKDQELGTRISIDGGTFTDCIPFGAAPGTSIEVKDLFYNTPARRKFLKTERTETNKISDILGKLALSNPQISFKMIVDGKVTIMTPGNGDLADAVTALYGYKVREDIFPIAYEAEDIIISGIVSKPSLIKSTRIWQTIIVNSRVISDKAVYKAIDNAYHALLPKNGFPLVLLNITVPAEMVDINVHPRKSEVKFADDKLVYRAVYHAVLNAIANPLRQMPDSIASTDSREDTIATAVDYDKVFGSSRNEGYTLMRDQTMDFVNQLKRDGYEGKSKVTYQQGSFMDEASFSQVPSIATSYTEADKAKFHEIHEILESSSYSSSNKDNAAVQEVNREIANYSEHQSVNRVIKSSGLLPMGQVASCYILAKKGDDLYIIDQHAAHERVRYDKLCKSAESIPMQDLLIPIFVSASDDEMTMVEENEADLLDLGFAVELGGPSQIKITGLPVDIVESKGVEILSHVFTFLQDQQKPTKAQLRHEMLAYASCRGAIKAGHNLNIYQMSVLIEDLFTTDKPFVCPHGRPTIIKFTPEELGRLFLRS